MAPEQHETTPAAAPEDAIATSKRSFERALRWQQWLTAVWFYFGTVVEPNRNLPVLAVIFALAALTIACGHAVKRADKARLPVLYQLYALLATILCCSLLFGVGGPSIKAVAQHDGRHLNDRAIFGTFLSMVYTGVSVRASTCAQRYGEAVSPLKAGKAE